VLDEQKYDRVWDDSLGVLHNKSTREDIFHSTRIRESRVVVFHG
jgi:hypothetical protein